MGEANENKRQRAQYTENLQESSICAADTWYGHSAVDNNHPSEKSLGKVFRSKGKAKSIW